MRKYKTGAIRNVVDNKLVYRCSSALTERIKAEYVYQHRFTDKGKYRQVDNWKKGFPLMDTYDSLLGHMQDVKLIMEGHKVTEEGKEKNMFDSLCGLAFNVDAMIDILGKKELKNKPVERLFQDDFKLVYKKYKKK